MDGQLEITDFIRPPKDDIGNYFKPGRQNALTRKQPQRITGKTDRDNREMIAKSSCLIINLQDGKGYFIPSEQDMMYVRAKLRLEQSRYNEIGKRIKQLNEFLLRHQGEC